MRLIDWRSVRKNTPLAAAFVLMVSALARASAQVAEELIRFEIPEQRADRALTDFAQQAGVSVLFPFDRVVEATANELVGEYIVTAGLQRLLAGTGLVGMVDTAGSISIEIIEDSTEEAEMIENRGFLAALFAALATGGVAGNVAGQELVSELTLEEIVVTARKRAESFQDVPVSISVIDSGLIEEAGIRNAYDLFENTPGITWKETLDRQGSRPTVRGVQTTAQNATRQKVSSFVDGFPLVGQQGGLQFVGIEQVEILRGPQSAAFGRATFAGAINYITRDPGEQFEGDIKLTASDLGRAEMQVALGGPISGAVGYTVDMNLDRFEGPEHWVSSEGRRLGGRETNYITGKVTFRPSDRVDGSVRLIYMEINDSPPIEYFMSRAERDSCSNITIGRGPSAKRYVQGEFNCEIAVPSGGYPQNYHPEEDYRSGTPPYYLVQANSVLDGFSNLDRSRIQANLNYNAVNGGALELLASYSQDALARWYDGDAGDAMAVISMGRILGIRNAYNSNDLDEYYMEARWVSPEDQPLRWLVGTSLYDYDSLSHVWFTYAGAVLGLEDEANRGMPFRPNLINSDVVTNTGIFASINYDLTDRTMISLEARYQRDDVRAVETVTGDAFANTTESFQPRAALAHAFSDQVTGYVQLASGTNPANVNLGFVDPDKIASLRAANAAGAIAFDETTFLRYDEEQLTNLEAGLKGTFFNNRVNLAAALYKMDWQDMILAYGLNWDGAWNDGSFSRGRIFRGGDVQARTYLNAGDGDLTGLELEGRFLITQRFSVRAALTVATARFAKFCDPWSVTTLGMPPTDTIESGAITDCVDVAGNDLENQPDETLVLSPTFRSRAAPRSGWAWSARMDLRYASETFRDTVNIMQLPATTILNASLNFINSGWSIRLYGNNLTDIDTPRRVSYAGDSRIRVSGPGRENFRIQPRIPREIGLTASYSF